MVRQLIERIDTNWGIVGNTTYDNIMSTTRDTYKYMEGIDKREEKNLYSIELALLY